VGGVLKNQRQVGEKKVSVEGSREKERWLVEKG
jgi:hypothetical protein